MKFPREKIAAAIAVAKVIIAGYGVFASVKNLIDSVSEAKTGRSRKVIYVDAGDIPSDKVEDYLAEAQRHLTVNRGHRVGSTEIEVTVGDSFTSGGYATRSRRKQKCDRRQASGYAGRTKRC